MWAGNLKDEKPRDGDDEWTRCDGNGKECLNSWLLGRHPGRRTEMYT